jgi:hypothetical protein
MEFKNAALTVFGALALVLSASVSAATVDTLNASNPGSGKTFWTASNANKVSPYYRGESKDWGWQHDAVDGNINSASLSIKSFDVDAASGELDKIYAFNNDTSAFELLGRLGGSNDAFSFTKFNLTPSWFDEVAAGLRIMMRIDENNTGWKVSLSKSSLTIDSDALATAPITVNPGSVNAGQAPIPAAVWLFGSGLIGLFCIRRKLAV